MKRKQFFIDEASRVPNFIRVITHYTCGCSFSNDKWKCEKDADKICPTHNEYPKFSMLQLVAGVRPENAANKYHTFKTNL